MNSADELISAEGAFLFARSGEVYAAYIPPGVVDTRSAPSSTVQPLRVNLQPGTYEIAWFDPRSGGQLQKGSIQQVTGPGWQDVGRPDGADNEDWVVLVRRSE